MAPAGGLDRLSGTEIRDLIVSGTLSATEVVQSALERIELEDEALRSFLTVATDVALGEAHALDQSMRTGVEAGLLHGIPISIKDLFQTAGIRTTAGSLLYRDFVPDQDSVHAERVRRAGAVIVGKTNLPEFALFPRTVNRLGPECRNPWDLDRTPGGSSGGAAASVAAGLTPMAVASDGGGSIRIPAALCGVFGLYPSVGRVPRHGGYAGTNFFSSVGPVTRTVRDAATLLAVLAGRDDRDPGSSTNPVPDYLGSLDEGVTGDRFLWLSDGVDSAQVDPHVTGLAATAARRFEELGARVEIDSVGLDVDRWIDAFYVIMNADRYASIGQAVYEDSTSRALLSDYARDHFERARGISATEYSRALQTRTELIDWFRTRFVDHDFLVTPTVAIVAPRIDEPITRRPLVGFTFMVNFAGLTAATLPCGFVEGMPVGLQVIAPANREADLLRACRAFELAQPWGDHWPPEHRRTESR